MDEAWEAIEESVRWAVAQEDAWLDLVSESHRFEDSWTFWNYAFDVAIERRKLFLADQIMRDRIQLDDDFSAQPWLMSDYARVLEELSRYDEALTAIRSAIEDLPHDEELQLVEQRLLHKRAASS